MQRDTRGVGGTAALIAKVGLEVVERVFQARDPRAGAAARFGRLDQARDEISAEPPD